MSARVQLEGEARERGLDPSGLDDAQLALVVLVSLGTDIEQPASAFAGDLTPIRDHDGAYLMARALRTARWS